MFKCLFFFQWNCAYNYTENYNLAFKIEKPKGSTMCVIFCLSSQDWFCRIIIDIPYGITALCTLHLFAMCSLSVNVSCTCIVRIFCILDISFMEETIGESLIQIFVAILTLISSSAACFMLLISGDMLSGSFFNLLAKKTVPAGTRYL